MTLPAAAPMDSAAHRQDGDAGTRLIDHGVRTHIGRRPENQDRALALSTGAGLLFAVADGMGGSPGGALASRLACEQLEKALIGEGEKGGPEAPEALGRHLEEAVFRTDRFIRWTGRRRGPSADMGTTLSCLVITGRHSVIAHVGDSRIYRLRKGYLSCLTVDHTFVQDMISAGEVDPLQAGRHPLRHVLTNVVGTAEALDFVDSRIDDVDVGDRFLLCTDGLTGALSEAAIREALQGPSSAGRTAGRLVDRALNSGASDNVTAVVVTIDAIAG